MKIKLSNVCYVMSGVAVAVNPVYAVVWLGIGIVNHIVEHGQDKAVQQGKADATQMLLKMIADQPNHLERIKLLSSLTGCTNYEALQQLKAMGIIK